MANLLGGRTRARVRDGRRLARFLVAVLALLASVLAAPAARAQGTVEYLYDEIGRLKAVVAPSGERAEYDYDAAGNLIAIRRLGGTGLTISEFTPNAGPVGTVVTIYGSGFSATTANNTVRFNGTVSSVTSASTTQLQVTAPAGGTTGPISVTVGASTATSSESFTYTFGVLGPPTITSFTPDNGVPGTTVTISGTNFDTTPGATRVEFGGNVNGQIQSITPTQIVVTVPSTAGSGPITVVTPRGVVTSASDFIVPPTGYLYADILEKQRLTVGGGGASLNFNTASKYTMALFTGVQGRFYSVQLSALTTNPAGRQVDYKVFDPNNFQVLNGTLTDSLKTIHLPRLAKSGTYVVLFYLWNATGSMTLSVGQDPEIVGNESQLPVSVGVAGQTSRFVLAAAQGAVATVKASNVVTNPANQNVIFTMVRSDTGQQVAQSSASTSSDGTAFSIVAPSSTMYSVVVAPPYPATTTLTATLNPAMDLTTIGPSINIGTSTPGYLVRRYFAGIAGQNLGVGLSGLAYNPSSGSGTVMRVRMPDGGQLTYADCYTASPDGGCGVNAVNLPVSGTYTIELQPPTNVAISAGTLTLSSDLTGTLVAGTPLNLNLARKGQNGRPTFSGTAGQAATVTFDNLVTTPTNQNVTFRLYRTDTGAEVANTTGSPGTDGASIHVASLPASATYAAFVDPAFASTATLTVTLNPVMDITIDGPSVAISSGGPGYYARLYFAGTAGQNLGLGLSGLTYNPSSGSNTVLRVRRPDGGQIASADCYTSSPDSGCSVNLANLPATGIYTIEVQPPSNVAINAGTLTLSSDVAGTLNAGTPLNMNLARKGQNGRPTFAGTVGTALTLTFDNLVTTPANQNITFRLYRTDTGAEVANTTGSPGTDGASLYIASLPATATYSVFVDPAFAATATLTVTRNPTMDITIGGASVNISSSAPGYAARRYFTGTAGQNLGLGLSGLTFNPASGANAVLKVKKPDGNDLMSAVDCYTASPGSGCNANLVNLPVTGTYTIEVQPPSNVAISAGTLTLSTDLTGNLASGTPLNRNLSRKGQNARLSFSGTAGQAVTLTFDNLVTTPTNQNVIFRLYRSDTGAEVANTTGSPGTDGASIYVPSLPATTTYRVFVDPAFAATATLTVTRNPTMDITIGGASINISSSAPGYYARRYFTGTVGQNLGLGLSGLTFNPASGANAVLKVKKPDGGDLIFAVNCYTASPDGGCGANLVNLPVTGTYTIEVQPPSNVAISAGTLTLSSDVTGTLTIGGAAQGVTIARKGQNARYNFSGNAGQLLRLNVTSLATTPAGQSVTFAIVNPDGSTLDSTASSGPTVSYDIPALPTMGTYKVFVDPAFSATATMTMSISTR